MLEIHNNVLIEWLQQQSKKTLLTASVCTGAFLLAEAGLLNGKLATTHWMDLDKLEEEYSEIEVCRFVKYVDEVTANRMAYDVY